jgi:hypothetical protein
MTPRSASCPRHPTRFRRRPATTTCNKQAIVNSYNYSVAMEERVANRFNEAVRSYKERKAAAEG